MVEFWKASRDPRQCPGWGHSWDLDRQLCESIEMDDYGLNQVYERFESKFSRIKLGVYIRPFSNMIVLRIVS